MIKSADFNPQDYDSMKYFLFGGERLPHTYREYLRLNLKPGVFGVANGATECGMVTEFDQARDTSEITDNIVGKLRENAMCKIIDVKTGETLGPNQLGEIFVKTETMFSVK